MLLTLFTVTDADNVIGKTMQEVQRMNIVLKRDTDIVKPRLLLVPTLPQGFTGINYAEIPELKRYYFVDSVRNLTNTLWELNLRCDVLETYKPQILESVALFRRKIKPGDCINVDVDTCVYKTVKGYQSNQTWVAGKSLILSTVGENS